MRKKILAPVMAAIIAAGFVSSALATTISAGGTVNSTVLGSSSIYQIFGHPGDPGGDYGPATDAVLLSFSAGPGNVFTFSVSGSTDCCSGYPLTPPDGIVGTTTPTGTDITGTNGLSNAIGNTQLPLLGVFTTSIDPFGSAPPPSLPWNANDPTSLSPELDQVFYIGDGKSGYINEAGSILQFTAPAGATQLYLGVADAYSFNGLTGYYNDNTGSYAVTTDLTTIAPVPEPPRYALILSGLGVVGFAAWRKNKNGTMKSA